MNLFDVVVVIVAVVAAIGGYRLGFLARVTSWIGLGLGLYLAARFLPRVITAVHFSDAVSRLLLAAIILIGGAFIGQAVGLVVGSRLHRVLPFGPLRAVDRGIGAGVGFVGVAVALWLLLPSIAAVPGWPARATRGSVVSRWVSAHFPQPPDTVEVLRRLVGQDTFPQVFAELQPGEKIGAAPAANPLGSALTASVQASTVKVEGQACDRIQDGSGFAIGPDLIVTNAHVVAGEPRDSTDVLLPTGVRLPATVVLFDPNRDLALLSVPNLGEKPLSTGVGTVGTSGAVFGHPKGQNLPAVMPAVVAQEVTAVGRDLYDSHTTKRDVFILASVLQPGDSGGALVNTAGLVIGVAFAIAPDQPGTSYALTSKELGAFMAQRVGGPVSSGACLTG